MKLKLKVLLFTISICSLFIACKEEDAEQGKTEQLTYYKERSNGKIISEKAFLKETKKQEFIFKNNSNIAFSVIYVDTINKPDSLIYVYKYDLKADAEGLKQEQKEAVKEVVKSKKSVDFTKLTTIENKNVEQIRAKNKATVIYIWKTKAKNCANDFELIESLNKNYNVFSLTHEPKSSVAAFVKEKSFKVNHIVGAPYFLSKMKITRTRQALIISKDAKLAEIIDLSALSSSEAKSQLENALKAL